MPIEKRENTLEYKMLAYNEHITSCLSRQRCSYKEELARAKLQFEVFNNIGDTLAMRNQKMFGENFHVFNYKNAIDYYKAALKVCREQGQKSEMCKKIAHICRQLEDEEAWVDINWQMVDYLKDKDKSRACLDLAQYVKDNDDLAVKILEKGLRYAFAEGVPPSQKNKYALKICGELKSLYKKNQDESAYERIKDREKSIRALAER